MLIYRGWGILAILIPLCTILAGIYFFGLNGNSSLELFLYSLLASAPMVFFLGIGLNRKSRHDLYFIALQYWGIIWAVVAIVVLACRSI
ncbi:hypothetical protein ACSBL2_22335 [Pedobacter sp. AW31-3R]|uniref:hypothetical protein n=1 Tax=Pedobacter sp. AW31-3R TaxID=3445781 RepID=UPI003FA020A8